VTAASASVTLNPMRLRLIHAGYNLAWLALWLTAPLHRGRGRGGTKAILTHGGRILLVQHTYGPRRWELPGGGLRRGEAPLDGVRREIREELAVELGEVRLIAYGRGSQRDERVISVFAAELSSASVTPDDREISRAHWHSPDTLPAGLGWQVSAAVAAWRANGGEHPVRLGA
jgi:ADP-ribose pyrophosphatase YjhB (NUDIX family)